MQPMQTTDTIAAISTAPGEGAVGIIRISGPGALATALKVFRPKSRTFKNPEPRYIYYGEFIRPDASVDGSSAIDSGLFVYMSAPGSYTGEETVELNCHGGQLVLGALLEAVVRAGARLAEPGEFTRRAFVNGKLDLAQAEAVIDVIRAQTETALTSARGRLAGLFSARVNAAKDPLVELLMRIEVELDFSEEEIDPLGADVIGKELTKAAGLIGRILDTYEEGRALRDGVGVVILGAPNVGKSSLLNILLEEERAIVTPVPGTTRDVIEETLNIRGLPVRLMDTAGLRDTADHVEAIGVRLARERVKGAQLVLFVVDAQEDASGSAELLEAAEGKKVVVVVNKTDLADEALLAGIKKRYSARKVSFISALTGEGIEGLKDAIYEQATGHPYNVAGEAPPGELAVSLRHKQLLEKALEGVERADRALADGLAGEFVASDIRIALDSLGGITGETTPDDILERIFSTFCIGK